MISLATFIDLRKAFNTVNHDILVSKLACYGISNGNLAWCTNYLSNRSQRTLANGRTSNNQSVLCGVPQGSVLGPLFFILYVNDVKNAVKSADIQLYADDTVIYVSGKNTVDAISKVQPELDKFSKWCTENKLSLNVSKTKLMTFGTRHKVKMAENAMVNMNNSRLQIVPTYKYLGFVLDSTLTFNSQVKNIVNTVTYKANILSLRHYRQGCPNHL